MSDNFEENLSNALKSQDPEPEPGRLARLRELVMNEYGRISRKILLYNAVAHCLFGALLAYHLVRMWGGGLGIKPTILHLSVVFLTGLGLAIMKLWYWIVAGKLDILQELKLMRLREEGQPLATPEFRSYAALQVEKNSSFGMSVRLAAIAGPVAGVLLATLANFAN